VNVIRRNHVVQYDQTVSLGRLQKQLNPPSSIPCKLQEEFSLMTAVRNVPDLAGQVVSLRSRHARLSISLLLPSKMRIFPRFQPVSQTFYEPSPPVHLARPLPPDIVNSGGLTPFSPLFAATLKMRNSPPFHEPSRINGRSSVFFSGLTFERETSMF